MTIPIRILDPRQNMHMQGGVDADCQPHRVDHPAGDAGPNYAQYVTNESYFLIVREVIVADVTTTDYYLNKDITDVDTDWTGRAGLTYVRLDTLL